MKTHTREWLKHDLPWGIGLGTAVVLCIQILTWVGLGLTHWTWVSTYAMVVVFSILGTRSLRKHLTVRPGFPRAALLIALMVLVSKLMEQTYMFVYINFVDPTWVETVAELWSGQLRDTGVSEARIARLIADFRHQWQTSYIFSLGILRYGIAQLILGLITATVVVQPWRKRSTRGSVSP